MGYLYSVLCAMFWAMSLVMFKSIPQLPAMRVNLTKNLMALAFLLLSLWIIEGRLLPVAGGEETRILLISGFVGIGIADAMVLFALTRLPAGLVSLLECSYAPMVLVLSVSLLAEVLTPVQFFGGALIVGGSVTAASQGFLDKDLQKIKIDRLGCVLMVVALLLMAIGVVMVKPLYERVGLWDILVIRMTAGVVSAAVIYGFFREPQTISQCCPKMMSKLKFWAACFFASYLGLVFWIAGYKYIDASIASALNQTSTAFTLIFAAVFLGERLSRRGRLAVLATAIGVVLITLS